MEQLITTSLLFDDFSQFFYAFAVTLMNPMTEGEWGSLKLCGHTLYLFSSHLHLTFDSTSLVICVCWIFWTISVICPSYTICHISVIWARKVL